MRYAFIDIGTNSVRLAVMETGKDGLTEVTQALKTTRLGSGLAKTGKLSGEGREATLSAIREFCVLARAKGASVIRAFGTSAMREGRDGPSFAEEISKSLAVPVHILTQEEEAVHSFSGVLKTLADMPENPLVFDLGGGSCELSWYDRGISHTSLKIGAVYLTEAFFLHDPPLDKEVAAAREHAGKWLARVPLSGKQPVGTGGTVTSLAAISLGLTAYNANRVHGFCLSRESVRFLLNRLLSAGVRERETFLGAIKDRAAILPAGTLVVDELLKQSGAEELLVSDAGILAGYAWSVISEGA